MFIVESPKFLENPTYGIIQIAIYIILLAVAAPVVPAAPNPINKLLNCSTFNNSWTIGPYSWKTYTANLIVLWSVQMVTLITVGE